MARPVYTTDFISQEVDPGGLAVYEVPAGFVGVMRYVALSIAAPIASGGTFKVTVAGNTWRIYRFPGGVEAEWFDHMRVAAPGPTTITAGFSDGDAATAVILMTGYLLSA